MIKDGCGCGSLGAEEMTSSPEMEERNPFMIDEELLEEFDPESDPIEYHITTIPGQVIHIVAGNPNHTSLPPREDQTTYEELVETHQEDIATLTDEYQEKLAYKDLEIAAFQQERERGMSQIASLEADIKTLQRVIEDERQANRAAHLQVEQLSGHIRDLRLALQAITNVSEVQ
jgi:hypothetical protein